ncbi:P-loop containing nucleoside triphosphate hydrolase protein [Dioscorea alata]|uniref:P-loop containing nucleoside triphosphate hydrolase protein n=1 Tax=Dioscorea alata TaxID=55571 RepID=A0ACB7UEG0_DIOAL|nr:P-loop containing nucleoside triphosphate hydrolase protein [Dioscorea alata]
MLPKIPMTLLLRFTASAITATAAFLYIRRIRREISLSALRRQIREALQPLLPRPPSILIMGFRSQGKSSFLNTACRALASESDPVLLLRAETAPPGAAPVSQSSRTVRSFVADPGGAGVEPVAVDLIDGPPLPDAAGMTRADVETAIAGTPAPECVILVFRCSGSLKERAIAVKKLTDIASVVRERGLHVVVVLTHKKVLRNMKQTEELQREVAFRARTDCVYFIENYTASPNISIHHPTTIKNDHDTNFTALSIMRQCVEFTRLYRSHTTSPKTLFTSALATSSPGLTKSMSRKIDAFRPQDLLK